MGHIDRTERTPQSALTPTCRRDSATSQRFRRQTAHPPDLMGNASYLTRVNPPRTTRETICEVTHAVPVVDADDHVLRTVGHGRREYPCDHAGGLSAGMKRKPRPRGRGFRFGESGSELFAEFAGW